jgi:uncharacterized membrane protein YhaH (DUF805 family)
MKVKLPSSAFNWTTFIGGMLAMITFLIIVFLYIVSLIFDKGSSYLGLFIYIVLPAFFILGLILVPIGMIAKRKRDKKNIGGDWKRFPVIDINDPRHRKYIIIFSATTIVILFASGVGSYETFNYTESVPFCGTLCHKVMEPEYTAYQNSPHAQVACVQCHVGEGVDWYVRSKMSGLRQVWAVTTNSYKRPIETPIKNLRPARETCEKCHWPQKFYANKMVVQKSFLADSSTEWDIVMKMKIGPDYSAMGFTEGIHWHINKNTKIEYQCVDDKRESIPWVKYTNLATGKTEIFTDSETPMTDSLKAKSELRTMDCMDCHNRPSHSYKSPTVYIDNALTAGKISKNIPQIKKAAMDVLYQNYGTLDSAYFNIETKIIKFYKNNQAEYYKNNKQLVDNAIKVIKEEYSKNAFPFMKVTYEKYPNHIGHLESKGCFRCHNGTHKSESGKVISKDCNLCHVILAQGKPGSMKSVGVLDTMQFQHPIDIDNEWKTTPCSECHAKLY